MVSIRPSALRPEEPETPALWSRFHSFNCPRASGREEHELPGLPSAPPCFNPPPGAQAGRNTNTKPDAPRSFCFIRPSVQAGRKPRQQRGPVSSAHRFNPPPALRPGGTTAHRGSIGIESLICLPKAQAVEGTRRHAWQKVIHPSSFNRPRVSGREERVAFCYCGMHPNCFNPPLGVRAGGTTTLAADVAAFEMFQLPPPLRPERNARRPVRSPAWEAQVSIRPQRSGREEHRGALRAHLDEFQSAPALRPGGTPPAFHLANVMPVSIRPRRSGREELNQIFGLASDDMFQSAPGAQAGGTALS